MEEQFTSPTWVNLILPELEAKDHDCSRTYRIGDLAKEFGVTLRTLRFYEDRGLVTPERIGSQRIYNAADRFRLKLILLAKKVGFSLIEIDEIMTLFDNKSSDDENVGKILAMFKKQREVMTAQHIQVETAIGQLEDIIGTLETG